MRIQIKSEIEKRDIITDTAKIQRIISCQQEQLHDNKLENIEKADKFLDTYNLARLNHKEIQNLNSPITSNEIEGIIKSFPIKKNLGLNGFTAEL